MCPALPLLRRSLLVTTLLSLGVSGCGHPATEADCDEIVERIARLELEREYPNDPKLVAEEISRAKESLKQTTMKDCVGKRITDKALQCVRTAKTSKDIVERCFD